MAILRSGAPSDVSESEKAAVMVKEEELRRCFGRRRSRRLPPSRRPNRCPPHRLRLSRVPRCRPPPPT